MSVPMLQPTSQTDAGTLMRYDANKKSVAVAYLLLLVVGFFGAHRFYLGRKGSAIAMLVLAIASLVLSLVIVGLFGIVALYVWIFVDLFLVPGIAREYNNRLIAALGVNQGSLAVF